MSRLTRRFNDELYATKVLVSQITGDSPDNAASTKQYVLSNKDVIIVANTGERDAIPDSQRKIGLLVYVVSEKAEYRLVGGILNTNWTLENVNINLSATTTTKTYYVSSTGSDTTGDGSLATPWATLYHCLITIPSVLGHTTTIVLGAGVWSFDENVLEILSKFTLNASLNIHGSLTLARSGFSTSGQITEPDNPFKKRVNVTWDSVNQYFGYCAKHANGVYASVGPHDTNNISSAVMPENDASAVTEIYEYSSTFYFSASRLPKLIQGSQSVYFYDAKVTVASAKSFNMRATVSRATFQNCSFEPLAATKLYNINGFFDFRRCLIKSAASSPAGAFINLEGENQVRMQGVIIAHTNPAVSVSPAIILSNTDFLFSQMWIYGFMSAFHMEEANNTINTQYGHYPNMIENCGVVFSLACGGFTFNSGKYYGTHKLYIKNVNYMFALAGAENNLQIDLRGYIPNNAKPLQKWFVPSTGGLWQGNPTRITALKTRPDNYIDVGKNSKFLFDELFAEFSDQVKSVISTSANNVINIGNIDQNLDMVVDYYLEYEHTAGGIYTKYFISGQYQVINNQIASPKILTEHTKMLRTDDNDVSIDILENDTSSFTINSNVDGSNNVTMEIDISTHPEILQIRNVSMNYTVRRKMLPTYNA